MINYPLVQGRDRILIVGGDDATRAGYLAELLAAGFVAEDRGGVLEDAEGADLVLIAGGAEHSRRDGFGADDVVVCPPIGGALLARVRAGLKMASARVALERFERYGDALSHIGGSV